MRLHRPSWGLLKSRRQHRRCSQPAINAGEFHRSYVSTYLERFLRACALRSGQLLNRADLLRSPLIGALWETLVVGDLRRALLIGGGAGRSLLARRYQMERTSRIQRCPPAASGGR